MSEDKVKEVVEKTDNEDTVTEVDPYEEKARAKGWVPEDEWNNPDKEWIDAKEFLQRDSFFKKISSLKYEISQLRESMKAREEQHIKLLEKERKEAIERLKKEKKEALTMGEVEKALTIDEELDTLRDAAVEVQPLPTEPPPEFVNWVGENSWYHEYPSLRAEADAIGPAIAQTNPGLSYQEVLEKVTKQIKLSHPDVFPRKQVNSKAEPGNKRQTRKSSGKSITLKDLPEHDQRVARTLIRNGVLTEEEYLKDYQKLS